MVFVLEYFRWHYTKGVKDLLGIIANFLWFFYEFFSIPLLLRTFFAPFHRLSEGYPSIVHLSTILEAVVVNVLMRIVGMFLRTILVLFGCFFIILTLVLGAAFFVAWIAVPLLLLFLILFGLKLIVLP